jgi:hypothetical protein
MRRAPRVVAPLVSVAIILGVMAAFAQPVAASGSTPGYSAVVMADHPSAFWRLNEASGPSAADASGNGNTGAYAASGVTYGTTAAVPGDTAVTLDGNSGAITAPNSATLNPTSGLTLEAWVKPTSVGGNQEPLVLKGFTSHTPPYYQYGLFLYDYGAYPRDVSFALSLGGAFVNIDAINTGWQYGVWNHVVATYDGQSMSIYVDGVLRARRTASGAIDTYPTDVTLGKYANITGQTLNGGLGEAAIYSTAMTAARIQAHYWASAPSTAGLASATPYRTAILADHPGGFWPLNEPAGVDAHDQSGNANNGSFSSAGVSFGVAGPLKSGDRAVTLDGATGNVTMPDAPSLDPTGSLTLEAWVKPTSVTGQVPLIVKNTPAWSEPYYQYGLFLYDGGSSREAILQLSTGGARRELDALNSGWVYGAWNHIVGTYDGQYMRIYVNGVQRAVQSQMGALDTSTMPLELGGYTTGSGEPALSAAIGQVAIYPTALSAARVSAHYTAAAATSKKTGHPRRCRHGEREDDSLRGGCR